MSPSNSPLLFDFDDSDMFSTSTSAATYASPCDLQLKPKREGESDPMTIPLGWDLSPPPMTATSDKSHPSPSPNPHSYSGLGVPQSHSSHSHTHSHSHPSTSASSALYSVSAPPLAPLAALDDSSLFSPSFWQNEYMNPLDNVLVDARGHHKHIAESLSSPTNNSAIPWAQWTNVSSLDGEPDLSREDSDMPQTPVDAFSINVDLYQPNSSDIAYPQSSQQNHDLLSPFNSLGLSSPPMYPNTIQPSCPSDHPSHNPAMLYGPPSMYYDPAHTHYDTPSPPASVASVPPTSLDLTSANVKVTPSPEHPAQAARRKNNIPTLSSSLPTSLASPQPLSGNQYSKPSPPRASPPTQGYGPTRGTRSRTISDVSRPNPRRRGHSSLDVPDVGGGPIDSLKPPKQSLSTWQFFFTEWIQKQDGRKLNVAQAAKEAGKEYKMLTKAEKEPYARRAAAARESRQQALSEWHQTLTPSLIALENRYRTAQRKMGLSRRSNLKDPNAPKKPLSAYFMFLKAVREDPTWSDSIFGSEKETTRQSCLAAAHWRNMSDDAKRPFLARAEQEKLQYEAARKVYEDSFGAEESASKGYSYSPHGYNALDDFGSPRPRSNSIGSTAMAFRLDDLGVDQPSDGAPSMGYFSASSSVHTAIPIHIPKGRPRSGSSPSPIAPNF